MLLAPLMLVALPLAAPQGDAVPFTLVPKGGMAKVGYYQPARAEFGAEKPASISKVPDGLLAPSYGTLPVGAGVAFIVDEPESGTSRLFVDTNRNGDLSDDPACEWKGKPATNADGQTFTMFQGSAQVDIGEAGHPVLVSIGCYRFDKRDPSREMLKTTLLYYRDYVSEGTLDVGGRKCKALLDDGLASGDFRGSEAGGEEGSGVQLMLDVNGNGKFDTRGESFDVRKPFNVGGTTWELADIARDGSSLRLVKSTQTVAEIATPPDLSVGQIMPAFEATDTAGKTLKFPGDYAGKVVLLDFWATWCGPCMHEMPNVVAAYGKLHEKGFEVQGISLDNEKTIGRMPDVMQKAGMTWRQVADGKGWKAEIADRFAIQSIPATFLVDGTTGKILGADLRGDDLAIAVEKALSARPSP